MDFIESLSPLLKTFWFIAIPTTLIFIFQTIMTFIGVDSGDGLDADFNGDFDGADAPFQLFSLRNLVNFLLGFSWTGITFQHVIPNEALLITIAFLIGVAFLVVFFLVIRQVKRLAEDNSFQMTEVTGKPAEVYLRIPGNKAGKGKVLVSVKGSMRELDAMTESPEVITTGSVVRIARVENNILIVELI